MQSSADADAENDQKFLAENDKSYTPREIVAELDKFIIGQKNAKHAVALALRNRWRRKRVDAALRDEIAPKNIILIGATGVGKTEIARRLAKLAHAPFLKVEASKFTEVGYVGRDVDSIIRDLTEAAIQMVQKQAKEHVASRADAQAEERLLDLLLPQPKLPQAPLRPQTPFGADPATNDAAASAARPAGAAADPAPGSDRGRERLREMLRRGELDHREVEIDAEDRRTPPVPMFLHAGMEEMGHGLQDMMAQMMGKRTRKRRMSIAQARRLLSEQEAHKLIDPEAIVQQAVERTEQSGIVFLDEIDKIARRESRGQGADVSREGVQRDILPIVEGSTVTTKHGPVRTDHILFIAAGAFHVSKVSDLIPELQGRFPIRVELESLGEAELLRILSEPKNALPVQYAALLAAEDVTLTFENGGLAALARLAAQANATSENIGARRLHTVLEKLLEDISFHAPERPGSRMVIDAAYVEKTLGTLLQNEDLTRYIL